MAQQLTINGVAPPALGGGQTRFVFDTDRVLLTDLAVSQRTRTQVIPQDGARSKVVRLGIEPARVSITGRLRVVEWWGSLSPAQQRSPADFIYPLNIYFNQGNEVTFTEKGRFTIPDGRYIITALEPDVVRNWDGAAQEVEYRLEFLGGD